MTGAVLHALNDIEPLVRPASSPHLVLLKPNERTDLALGNLPDQFEGALRHMQAEIDFLRAQVREQERQHILKDTLLKNARIREQTLRAELYN